MIKVESKRNTSTTIILIIVIIFVSIIIAAYSINKEEQYDLQNISIIGDQPVLENIEDMSQNSDLIVIGYYEREVGTMNLYRDPTDMLKESLTDYEEAKIYDFKVEEILLGELDKDKINIALNYSNDFRFIDKKGGEQIINIQNPLYIEPDTSKRYLLFLDGNEKLDEYFIPFHPYSLEIDKNNTVKLESNLLKDSVDYRNKATTIVKLKETKEELRIKYHEDYDSLTDSITGKKLTEVRNIIKETELKKTIN